MAYRKLGRTSSQRKAMLRDLTTDLLINESIVTTEARAKEIRKTVEKMITLGKRGDLHACRQAAAFVRNEIASENTIGGQDHRGGVVAHQLGGSLDRRVLQAGDQPRRHARPLAGS